jgi:hypothetical protein
VPPLADRDRRRLGREDLPRQGHEQPRGCDQNEDAVDRDGDEDPIHRPPMLTACGRSNSLMCGERVALPVSTPGRRIGGRLLKQTPYAFQQTPPLSGGSSPRRWSGPARASPSGEPRCGRAGGHETFLEWKLLSGNGQVVSGQGGDPSPLEVSRQSWSPSTGWRPVGRHRLTYATPSRSFRRPVGRSANAE